MRSSVPQGWEGSVMFCETNGQCTAQYIAMGEAPPRSSTAGRQNRWRELDSLTVGSAVAQARLAHLHRADPGHPRTLRQMAVAHQPLATILGLEVSVGL